MNETSNTTNGKSSSDTPRSLIGPAMLMVLIFLAAKTVIVRYQLANAGITPVIDLGSQVIRARKPTPTKLLEVPKFKENFR